jgi:hypothetical protein
VPASEYRAKPVQAIRWIGESNCAEVFSFLGMDHPDDETDHGLIFLGDDEAEPGDWLVRDGRGRLRAVSNDDFAATYEPTTQGA